MLHGVGVRSVDEGVDNEEGRGRWQGEEKMAVAQGRGAGGAAGLRRLSQRRWQQ